MNKTTTAPEILSAKDKLLIPRSLLEKWLALLAIDGHNTKSMVKNDIQEVLKK